MGIASHNLFTLAYGLVLAVQNQALEQVQFEMLEGMANHQRRALFELSQNMLLYAPACRQEDFINAIGYLVRRFDENTGEENFSTPRLQPRSRQRRLAATANRHSSIPSNRMQDGVCRTETASKIVESQESGKPEAGLVASALSTFYQRSRHRLVLAGKWRLGR